MPNMQSKGQVFSGHWHEFGPWCEHFCNIPSSEAVFPHVLCSEPSLVGIICIQADNFSSSPPACGLLEEKQKVSGCSEGLWLTQMCLIYYVNSFVSPSNIAIMNWEYSLVHTGDPGFKPEHYKKNCNSMVDHEGTFEKNELKWMGKTISNSFLKTFITGWRDNIEDRTLDLYLDNLFDSQQYIQSTQHHQE